MSQPQDAVAQVAPGMEVETTEGDQGKHDLSKPKVAEVVTEADGAPRRAGHRAVHAISAARVRRRRPTDAMPRD